MSFLFQSKTCRTDSTVSVVSFDPKSVAIGPLQRELYAKNYFLNRFFDHNYRNMQIRKIELCQIDTTVAALSFDTKTVAI